MEPAIVTVITPHYDCARYVQEAISSILNQTFRQFELYVVDDSSPDDAWLDSVGEFSSDPRVRLYRTSRNVGPFRIANRVIRMTSASFITFQDADDRSDPRRLEKLLAAAERLRADVVGSAARYVDSEGRVMYVKRFGRNANFHLRLGRRFVMLNGTAMIRRASLERIGLFDGSAQFAADIEFIVRAHRLGLKLRNLRDVLYDYRRWPHSLTGADATGHGSQARESYIENVFARRRQDIQRPIDSDVEFELTPIQNPKSKN